MRVGLCVVVKNEAGSLLEWISAHIALGFDTLIVVDDASTDGTRDIVAKAARIYDIRLLSWTEEGKGKQGAAYTKIVRQFEDELDWIAFIDADEFIVPLSASSIHELLQGRAGQAAIALPWLMFGSSGHDKKPAGLVIENYTRRAEFSFRPNHHVKSIVRTKSVIRGLNPHYFEMRGEYHLPNSEAADWESPGVLKNYPNDSEWRIHHYFTRSKEHWQDRMGRGQLGAITRTMQDFERYDRNEVVDLAALRLAPVVRSLIDRTNSPVRGLNLKAFSSGKFHCNLDVITPSGVRGWASREENPGTPAVIQVVVDGRRVSAAICDGLRPDVLKSRIGLERVGFDVTFSRSFADGNPHFLQILDQAGSVVKFGLDGIVRKEYQFTFSSPDIARSEKATQPGQE